MPTSYQSFGSSFLKTAFYARFQYIIYATYLGGNGGDSGWAIAVNANGEAYVAGHTGSSDFPLEGGPVSSSMASGFLAKLNANGDDLLYSSYIGNNCTSAVACRVQSLAIDANEAVYMLSWATPSPQSGQAFKLILGQSQYEYSYSLGPGRWNSLALDGDGNAYFAGHTNVNPRNVIVDAVDNAGTRLYPASVSFGGTLDEYGWGITVDQDGYAYVTGFTNSNDFPKVGRQVTTRPPNSGITDAYVTILDPSGVIQYSSYVDVGQGGQSGDGEEAVSITVDEQGAIYLVGNTSISNIPSVCDYPYDSTCSVFVVKLIPSILKASYWLSYPEVIGGSCGDWTYSTTGTIDNNGNIYVTGESNSPDFLGTGTGEDYQAYTVKVSTSQLYPMLPELVTISPGSGDNCFGAAYNGVSGAVGGPINTRTGGYDYTVKDLSIPTSAGELVFQREYTSLSVGNPSAISPGWTHNHDIRLILPTDPEGISETILFKASTANKYTFAINSDGTYTAYPGLCATLVEEQGSFILKDGGQKTYTFNSSGKLVSYADPQGDTWNYLYHATTGKLERINADDAAHYLLLHYDPQGRIDNVIDHTGRSVTYHYTNGDLTSVDDVLQQSWLYQYEELPHYLTRVVAPGGVTVEKTMYDYEDYPVVRAWKQFDGGENLIVELIYNPDGTTTIKDEPDDANPETHTYDLRGTLTSNQSGAGGEQEKQYDFNFRPEVVRDALDNPTTLDWSSTGLNLEYIKDASDGETYIDYENLNSPNSPTKITDPLGHDTTYSYTNPNFPTLPTRIEYPLSFDNGSTFIGTNYEYYAPSNPEGQPAGKVKEMTDALGQKTRYTYTSSGQPDVVITAYGTSNAQTTDYDYDDLGRLVRVIDPTGRITRNKYDAASRLTVTINNVNPSTPNATDPPQNLISADGKNIYNLYTRYYYDGRGNQIAVVDTNWTITRTYYDLANRPVSVVQNLVIGAPASNETEAVAAINALLTNVPPYDSNQPDRNIRTDTEYDDKGNVIVTYDPQGIITRTYYDEVNRPKLVVQNWAGNDLYGDISTAPAYAPANPDQDVRTEYFYDLNGNLIAAKDTLDIITRTYFDALNRPVLIVQNWTGNNLLTDPPPSRDAGECGQVENVCTENFYDKNGNLIATRDPNGVITRTYYDSLNRPITVVQNLVGQTISNTNPPAHLSDALTAAISTNIRTDTWYDKAGNVVATQDPRGIWTRTYYDSANRPVAIIQNWTGSDLYGDFSTAPAYNPAFPDQNVRTTIAYNSDGYRDITTDALGHVTKYEYNDAGQLLKTIVNYINGGSPQNEENQRNIVTEYAYDALGKQISTKDTLGRVTLNNYDDLGRLTNVTQNHLQGQPQNYKDSVSLDRFNLITGYSYNARGNQIAVTDTSNTVTRTYYDALGRSVTVVRNLTGSITDPTPPDRPDPLSSTENVRTDTVYRGNGNIDYVIDEIGQITDHNYDDLGRLTSIIDPLSNPTSFEYDANSNRTLMTTFETETESASTKYEYDGLNRLKTVIENYRPNINPDVQTNVKTIYTYDANGNRLSIRDGNSNLENVLYRTIFTYDPLGRLKTETDPLGNTTSYTYDALGNRVKLFEANEKETIFVYDELNRLTTINYPSPDADITFDYDALGRRTNMDDGTGGFDPTTWAYNNLDLPKVITDPFGTEISYDYDPLGNRTDLSYANQTFTYTYDEMNRVSEVTGSGLLDRVEYNYYATGRLEKIIRPNGVNTTYHYFDNGWLEDIIHSAGSTTLASYQYQYYKNGNRSQAIEDILFPSTPPTATATPSQTPTSTSTTPTITPSQTATQTATNTPPVTNTFTPTATQSSSDLIFADDFESGNLSAWTSSTTDAGDLSVTAAAKLIGNYGMQALIDDANGIYVTDDTPAAEPRYRARFYFDPNSITMASGDAHFLFKGYAGTSTEILRVEFRQSAGAYQIRAALVNDGSTWTTTNWFTISDATHFIEFDWRAATAAGANDGGLTLWIDDIQQADLSNVDNDTRRVDRARLGAISGMDAGTSGIYYLDTFESRRTTYIGPAGQAPTATHTPTPVATDTPSQTPSGPTDTPTASATPTASLTPTPTSPSSNGAAYLSFSNSGTIGGVTFEDIDILYFDGANWSMYFDATDVGIPDSGHDINDFQILDADTLLLTFDEPITIGTLAVDAWDIVQFDATSLGATTAGTFSLYFDGNDVGLDDATNEILDALDILPDGRVLISTKGDFSVPGVTGKDEDLISFTPTALGDTTSGSWAMYFDGSLAALGLGNTAEDLDALELAANGDIYLSTVDVFAVTGVSGDDEDIFVCTPTYTSGAVTSCTYSSTLFFDGSAHGLAANDVDGMNLPLEFASALGGKYAPVVYRVAPPQQGEQLTFTPIADAYVDSSAPSTNSGTSTTLRADGSPDLNSYLRFDVQGLSGSVTSATLRIYANSASGTGYTLHSVSDNTWTETGITYNNAPAMGGQLGASGAITAGTWTTVDVNSYITGNGTYNFAFSTTSSTNISFSSREGANAPQLVIQTSSGPTNTPTPTASQTPAVTSTPSPTATLTSVHTPTVTPSVSPTPTQIPSGPVTIDYIYDPLNRLTEANYSNNDYYHYTYDAAGNRRTQQNMIGGLSPTSSYNYDHSNRLTDVSGVLYTWDDNGNLLNDGVNTYTYDSANRLKTLTGPSVNMSYSYNGLGDRLQETSNGSTTTFTMDLNTVLTQALSDGTNHYIYGVDRIAQTQGSTTEYFLEDALDSVRQMANTSAEITYGRAYDPYGVITLSGGSSQSAYGYTGEYSDSYIKLIYLRSRLYDSLTGRFTTKDSWQGDYNSPLSLNRWNYVEGNPVNRTDPSGQCFMTDGSNMMTGWRVWEYPIIGPCRDNSRPLSPDEPHWHEYWSANLVCSEWLACSREEVVDALSRFTFPGQNPLKPVQPDEQNFVAPFGWFPGTGFEYLGAIRSRVSLGGLQVRNESEPTHIFHKGQVDREARQIGKAWYVVTHGTGNNIFFAMDVVNQVTGTGIFTDVDRVMRQYLETTHILRWIKGIDC